MLLNFDHINPQKLAAVDSEGGLLTYSDILQLTSNMANIEPQRSLCFLLVENNVGGVAWVMSMLLGRHLVPLILNKKTESTLYEHLYATYKPKYVCAPDYMPLTGTCIFQTFGYTLYNMGNAPVNLFPELSHLLPTSGSTGSPKLVRHSYDNIEAAGLNISTFFHLSAADRPLLVLPLYYTMGLSIVFSHLLVGATLLITGRNMTDPVFWKFFKEQQASSFTGVPYSYQILDMMRFYRMDLPHLNLLTQGGGKMPTQLNEKFVSYCEQQGKQWIATYGQSECTARMAWLPAKWAREKMGSIGWAVPNGKLSLIDADGKPITTPHQEGEMCYQGKNVTLGYARCTEDLALGDERHGFIQTGDLAYFDQDGCYYIVGRIGRFLKLFGLRIGLDECEQIIATNCQTDTACVGTDEKMIVYITQTEKQHLVKETIISKTHLVATAFEIRVINEIPKNEAGKKLYSKLDKK